jgi:hypothetical protein
LGLGWTGSLLRWVEGIFFCFFTFFFFFWKMAAKSVGSNCIIDIVKSKLPAQPLPHLLEMAPMRRADTSLAEDVRPAKQTMIRNMLRWMNVGRQYALWYGLRGRSCLNAAT